MAQERAIRISADSTASVSPSERIGSTTPDNFAHRRIQRVNLRVSEEIATNPWRDPATTCQNLSTNRRPVVPSAVQPMQILGAIAGFERERIVERARAGLAQGKAQGKRLGRRAYAITPAQFAAVDGMSLRDAAASLGVSRSVVHRFRLSRKRFWDRHGARRLAAPGPGL